MFNVKVYQIYTFLNRYDDFGLTFWWGPGHAAITDQEVRDLEGETVTAGEGGGDLNISRECELSSERKKDFGDLGRKKNERNMESNLHV